METYPVTDRPGAAADPDWRCYDLTCAVCWLERRDGETRDDWLARLRRQPHPRLARGRPARID